MALKTYESNKGRRYNIYIEGYQATGQTAGARYLGSAWGESFEDACLNFSKTPDSRGWGTYSPNPPSFWACKLYDNLADAQRSFG